MKRIIITITMSVIGLAGLRAQDDSQWSLAKMVDYALENNINTKKSTLDLKSADASYRQAKNNKLPSLSGSTSYQLSNGSSIDQITNSWSSNMTNTNNFGVSADWSIYQGNKLNLNIQKSELQLEQSELYVEEAKNNIQLSVLEAYINAMYAHEAITITENTLAATLSQLEQAKVRFENGDIARDELADLETQYATNQSEVVSTQQNYQQKVLALKQLLELDPQSDFDIELVELDDETQFIPGKEDVFAQAVETLPTMKIYDNQRLQAEKDLAISKAGYLPTVSLSAGANTGYTDNINFSYINQLSNNIGEYVGINVSIPIFSKKQNKTNIALSQISIEQSELDKIQASKDLYANVETAWQNAVSSQAQQKASKTARDNAKLAYDLASKKYEFGDLTPSDLMVSRNTYLNAEQSYLQNKYMSLLYRQLLKYYQGKSITMLN
ncbi:MAG: TolC family protein [Bacteroidales bacterium]